MSNNVLVQKTVSEKKNLKCNILLHPGLNLEIGYKPFYIDIFESAVPILEIITFYDVICIAGILLISLFQYFDITVTVCFL